MRAFEREYDKLSRRRNNPPVHKLDVPIHQGWKRHFVLTPEAALLPDAPVLAAILAEINSTVWFWRRDFQRSRRAARLTRRSLSTEQHLYAFLTVDWERRGYPEAWRKYFHYELVPRNLVDRPRAETMRVAHWESVSHRPLLHEYTWALAFRYPRLFVLRVEKHWLTHVSEIEPGVIERMAEIDAWMDHHEARSRLLRLHGRRCWHCRSTNKPARILRKLAIREMRAHLGPLKQIDSPHAASVMPPSHTLLEMEARRWRRAGIGLSI